MAAWDLSALVGQTVYIQYAVSLASTPLQHQKHRVKATTFIPTHELMTPGYLTLVGRLKVPQHHIHRRLHNARGLLGMALPSPQSQMGIARAQPQSFNETTLRDKFLLNYPPVFSMTLLPQNQLLVGQAADRLHWSPGSHP